MSTSDKLKEIVDDYMRHACVDYVGLWQIANRIRDDLELTDTKEIQRQTLIVVGQIVEQGLQPGDYFSTGFHFWSESKREAIIARIEREWGAGQGDPTLANPICWFAPRPR